MSLQYIEQAFNPAKYGEFSSQPVFEITIPSVHDSGMAPAGQHVLSAVVQYAPYNVADGRRQSRMPAGRHERARTTRARNRQVGIACRVVDAR